MTCEKVAKETSEEELVEEVEEVDLSWFVIKFNKEPE